MVTVSSPRGLPVPAVPTNLNTNWLDNPAAWLFYALLIALGWVVASGLTDPGMAWTWVHIGHGLVTYYLLHWNKGSPVGADQGKWDALTFWEQIDDGVQFTATRKFFTAVPVALFLLATHSAEYARQPLGVNLLVVVVLVVAKLSAMHRVRILGINRD
jgi:hypothetical protein